MRVTPAEQPRGNDLLNSADHRRGPYLNPAYLSALAALAGAAIGGLTSFATSWLTRRTQLSHTKTLYSDFTADRGETVENQLQPLQEAAGRLGWTVVAVFRDEGISGTRGRDKRPGLDALLIWQAVGQAEDDAVPGAAYSCSIG